MHFWVLGPFFLAMPSTGHGGATIILHIQYNALFRFCKGERVTVSLVVWDGGGSFYVVFWDWVKGNEVVR